MSAPRVCPACRFSRLSRYNSDPVCAACSKAIHETDSVAPTWLWDSVPMRQALARTDVGAMVAILRTAARLSQLELANVVEWSQANVSMIERGRRDTLYDIRELLRFVDAVDMPREALLPLVLGRPDAILETGDNVEIPGVVVDAVSRRSFNGMAAGLAAAGVLPPIRVPDKVDAGHVHYLQSCVAQLDGRGNELGGGAVLRQAMRQFARARAMLDESDYTAEIGRRLLVVIAELGILAGYEAFDCNDQALARRMYGEAELLAGTADDPALTVHVYTYMAQQSYFLARTNQQRGLAREALRFADQAAGAARHEPSPRLHALIALRQAMAHAQLGDELGFRSAITRAHREFDRGPHPADSPLSGFVTESEITNVEGWGRLSLGQPSRAAALFAAKLDDPARSRRDRTLRRTSLADAFLEQGDRSQAVAEGMTVLREFGEQLTSNRIFDRLRPLRAVAEQTAEEEFCARFDAAERALSN